jgi:selenide,water dikinase
LQEAHIGVARDWMCVPNRIGELLGGVGAVSAMTDVTGFGLAGHLLEICQGSNVRAKLDLDKVPAIDGVEHYIREGCIPGGTDRNFASYGEHMQEIPEADRALLCDPQTSGGLLVAVDSQAVADFEHCIRDAGMTLECIGELLAPGEGPLLAIEH